MLDVCQSEIHAEEFDSVLRAVGHFASKNFRAGNRQRAAAPGARPPHVAALAGSPRGARSGAFRRQRPSEPVTASVWSPVNSGACRHTVHRQARGFAGFRKRVRRFGRPSGLGFMNASQSAISVHSSMVTARMRRRTSRRLFANTSRRSEARPGANSLRAPMRGRFSTAYLSTFPGTPAASRAIPTRCSRPSGSWRWARAPRAKARAMRR